MKIESLPIFFNKLNRPCKILEKKKFISISKYILNTFLYFLLGELTMKPNISMEMTNKKKKTKDKLVKILIAAMKINHMKKKK